MGRFGYFVSATGDMGPVPPGQAERDEEIF